MKQNDINGQYSRIENSTNIKGDIISEGDFRIDGTLDGNIKTNGKIVIGKEGLVKGGISCNKADVEGKIKGNLFVSETLNLRSTSNIEGEVITGKLIVESGATFNASCSMNKDGKKAYHTYPERESIKPLTKQEALLITSQKTTLNPLEAILIEDVKPGSEYRGALPAYKVKTDSKDKINVYVGYMTGDISSIRSDSWRIWDLMWSLHIMDYRERDNINNILLKFLSVLALITSLSGITLFFVKK